MNASRATSQPKAQGEAHSIHGLIATGELRVSRDGCATLGPRASALLGWLNARFLSMAVEHGAVPRTFPVLLPAAALERADYFASFPERAVRTADGKHALEPAVCYHCYAMLADSVVRVPICITCCGRCYRNEASYDSLARLREFSMREVVFVGQKAWVEASREQWMSRIGSFASELGLGGHMEQASDPFFGAEARGRKLMQQVKTLKYELHVEGEHGQSVAAASFNLHEAFFGSRFNVTLPDGSPAHSACVAFGLERWLLALLVQRGSKSAFALARGGTR